MYGYYLQGLAYLYLYYLIRLCVLGCIKIRFIVSVLFLTNHTLTLLLPNPPPPPPTDQDNSNLSLYLS